MATDSTLAYYTQNAQKYADETRNLDMTDIRSAFLSMLQPGDHILDLGCGSGRDSLSFLENGFQVTALDGSPEIARIAGEYIKQEVHVMKVQEIPWKNRFNAIWACAVLVHIPKSEIRSILAKLYFAVKAKGVIYISLKQGYEERWDKHQRFYADYTIEEIGEVCRTTFPDTTTRLSIETSMQREHKQQWLNIIVQKNPPKAIR